MLEAIRLRDGELYVLDQLELPHEITYRQLKTTEDAHDAIKRMVVRGAPAIAMVGIAGIAVDVYSKFPKDTDTTKDYVLQKLDYIVTARPTAVNLANACNDLRAKLSSNLGEFLLEYAAEMLAADVATNRAIGAHGLAYAESLGEISVMTICNTGSLATAGYGTALGIVRALHAVGRLKRLYVLETRPYNQGARLTAFEAVHDGLPATLICDSMAAAAMQQDPTIKLSVAGADRVAANGDTANKIGTLQLAVVAKHFGTKFVVAAPTTSIDFKMKTGKEITIEERPADELTCVNGVRIAAKGIDVWNPAFDVTPGELIDAIVTENGLYECKRGRGR